MAHDNMGENHLAGWLLHNGGPIIRYLVSFELTNSNRDVSALARDLLRNDQIKQWIKRLPGLTGFNDIHGSKDTCFENAIGKLSLLGVRKGMRVFDRKCKSYLSWLHMNRNGHEATVIGVFMRTLVASMLANAGYISERLVRETVLERLDLIYDFVRRGDYSIYAEKKEYRGVPQAVRHYPLVHPDLYARGHFSLPWIYDILAFRALYEHRNDGTQRKKIEEVISYVLHPEYQRLHDGYGIVLTGKNRYQVMGWSVWLPGYDGMHDDAFKMGCLVQRLELMSHFPNVLSSSWFTSALNRLEEYSTDRGTYRFPRYYIKEKKNTYFVTGGHMGLGENRRQRSALEIESSFWAMKIKKSTKAVT